mmetsp:Transcript_80244/g.227230  ORF Transcript_80244/g.227230 Transcript_80244/m.227230 type:complete len:308 (+) Transcript_80244:1289-2212(+)
MVPSPTKRRAISPMHSLQKAWPQPPSCTKSVPGFSEKHTSQRCDCWRQTPSSVRWSCSMISMMAARGSTHSATARMSGVSADTARVTASLMPRISPVSARSISAQTNTIGWPGISSASRSISAQSRAISSAVSQMQAMWKLGSASAGYSGGRLTCRVSGGRCFTTTSERLAADCPASCLCLCCRICSFASSTAEICSSGAWWEPCAPPSCSLSSSGSAGSPSSASASIWTRTSSTPRSTGMRRAKATCPGSSLSTSQPSSNIAWRATSSSVCSAAFIARPPRAAPASSAGLMRGCYTCCRGRAWLAA